MHSQQPQPPLKLTGFAIALALVVVILGGFTRLADAGLGCPDWPGCYGEWILPSDSDGEKLAIAQQRFPHQQIEHDKGWIEMIHRYFAGTLGLVVLALALVAWRCRQQPDYPRLLSYGLLLLVIVQAAFGMWTVTLKLLPQVVTLHLLGGLLTLTLLIRLRQKLLNLKYQRQSSATARRFKPWVLVGFILLFGQIALGGWTSSNYAGWSCTAWINCQNQYPEPLDYAAAFDVTQEIGPNYQGGLLPASARAAIQMSHRIGALVSSVYILLLGLVLIRYSTMRIPVLVTTGLRLTQILLGILNIVFALPLSLALAHHAGAVALLMALLWVYQRSEQLKPLNHPSQQSPPSTRGSLSQEVSHA